MLRKSSKISWTYCTWQHAEEIYQWTKDEGGAVIKPPQVRPETCELTNVSPSLTWLMTNYPQEASSGWRWGRGRATEHSDIEKRQTVGVCLLPGRESATAAWLLTAHYPAREEALTRRRQEPLDGMITVCRSPCWPGCLASLPCCVAYICRCWEWITCCFSHWWKARVYCWETRGIHK